MDINQKSNYSLIANRTESSVLKTAIERSKARYEKVLMGNGETNYET